MTSGTRAPRAVPPIPPRAPGPARVGLFGAAALCSLVAFRRLFVVTPVDSFARELEGWFFVPAQTSAPVVVVLSLWLLYRRRERLRRVPPARGWTSLALGVGLGLGGAAGIAWATGVGASELLAPALALTGLGIAAIFRGAAGLRVVWLPAAFLLFAIPLPTPVLNEVAYRFQLWTAEYAGWILDLMAAPSLVSGDLIVRPEDNFVVIETCSGMRSVETLTMLAILMLDLFRRRGLHALALLVVAPFLGFALNGFRVVGLIFNPHGDIAAIHSLQGVAILLGGLGLLYLWDGFLERWLPSTGGADEISRAPGPGASLARPLVATGLLAAGAALSLWVPRWQPASPPYPSLHREVPASPSGWRSTLLKPDRVFLRGVTLRSSVYRRYERGGQVVDLFVGLGNQSHGARGVFSPKTAFPGSGWITEASGEARLEPDGVSVASYRVRSGTETRLVYHWYMGTDGFGDEVLRSLFALEASPLRRGAPALVVRMSTPLDGPPDSALMRAEARLRRFFEVIRPALSSLGGQVGQWKRFSCFSLSGKILSPEPPVSVNSLSIKSIT